jgi:hypothetical protein
MPRKKGQLMSEWHNTGAKVLHGDSDIPTKTALKAAIKADPTNVVLYSTDAFGPNRGKRYLLDLLVIGDKYTVTGPNPYTSRKWYATVEKLPNGTIKVS